MNTVVTGAGSLFGFALHPFFVFDFSASNEDTKNMNLSDANVFDSHVKSMIKKNNAVVGIGKYAEDRVIYQRSALFGNERTIHLGVDIILPAGTAVHSPFDGVVHSFDDNKGFGDYGPTIILQHEIDGFVFFTLYGHLSRESLISIAEGQRIVKSQIIGEIGSKEINGQWFEHLHFQIILDMLNKKGDFPGVCCKDEKDKWLRLCPDPTQILKIPQLYKTL
ncbi:peptidoglycan DD-metalloendopeptidase family protein [Candidatus Woesearchaeota archaeon]|nr:peptidoglycan DD-metalloendopeptidase family protein [Candidatus Woesearchaeota archaeon]